MILISEQKSPDGVELMPCDRRVFVQSGVAGALSLIGAGFSGPFMADAAEPPTRADNEPTTGGVRLFLDRRWLERVRGLALEIAPSRLHPASPLTLDGESIWTRDNVHLVVGRTPDDRYRGWIDVLNPAPGATDWLTKFAIESADGLSWRRAGPQLALRNEAAILVEDHDPERRYKAVIQGWAELSAAGDIMRTVGKAEWLGEGGLQNRQLVRGIFATHSRDGLTWAKASRIVTEQLPEGKKYWTPGAPGWAGGDNFPGLIYDAARRKYVAFFRTNLDQGDRGSRRERAVGRAESADFTHWEPHELALHARAARQDALGFGKHDFYQLQAWPCGGVYLGIVSVYYWGEDRVHLELVWSPNTRDWERVCQGTDFIPHNRLGEPGGGCRFGAMRPLTVGDEVRVYFGGDAGQHNADRDRRGQVFLALFQRDRFAGLAAGEGATGELLTKPFPMGSGLQLNVQADGGEVTAELCDAQARPLPGYSLDVAAPMRGDHLAAPLRWTGEPPPVPPGTQVCLRLRIRGRATVYALGQPTPRATTR